MPRLPKLSFEENDNVMYRNHFWALAMLIFLFASACDLDNYDPPESDLSGAVVYDGERIGVRQGAVDLEMWQDGYELRDFIPLNIHQDGTFAAKLFDGEYKITRQNGGPWVMASTDSVVVQVDGDNVRITEGNAEVDENGDLLIPVTPYFMLRDVSVTLNNNTVTANFDVEQVVEDAELAEVGLYVNRTQFVSAVGAGANFGAVVQSAGELDDMEGIQLTLPLSEAQREGQSAVYARVAVETVGIQQRLYSQVFVLELGDQ